jgi:hypothetical protein
VPWVRGLVQENEEKDLLSSLQDALLRLLAKHGGAYDTLVRKGRGARDVAAGQRFEVRPARARMGGGVCRRGQLALPSWLPFPSAVQLFPAFPALSHAPLPHLYPFLHEVLRHCGRGLTCLRRAK